MNLIVSSTSRSSRFITPMDFLSIGYNSSAKKISPPPPVLSNGRTLSLVSKLDPFVFHAFVERKNECSFERANGIVVSDSL